MVIGASSWIKLPADKALANPDATRCSARIAYLGDHETTDGSAELKVRIQSSPADSPSLSGFPSPLLEKPRFSAIVAGRVGRQCRQRPAKSSNIAPRRRNVSVGRYSSTAVLPDAVCEIGGTGCK